MRAFTMYRRAVPKGTHNELQAKPPDGPQFEGVVWSDGTCTIRWLTAKGSTAVWQSLEDMLAIHGHPEYGSERVWHDIIIGGGAVPADLQLRTIGAEAVRREILGMDNG